VALYPNVAPFADNRVDGCDLLQRNVIHHGTGKASGISSWYTGQIDRLQTIGSARSSTYAGTGTVPHGLVIPEAATYEEIVARFEARIMP
jgi:hypothetical protein